jgi:hypothetical protein
VGRSARGLSAAALLVWNTTSYRLIGPSYPPDDPPLTDRVVKSAFELAWNADLRAGRSHEPRRPAADPDARRRRQERIRAQPVAAVAEKGLITIAAATARSSSTS